MKTTGDMILDRTLDKVGGKGLFVKELDKSLMDRRTDLSVHSLKDVPMEVSEELPLIGFSQREDPRDALVLPKGVSELKPGVRIGSSSQRRILQLKHLFPFNDVAPVRGNIQTRLRKLDEGEVGALVLAAAGLKRLDLGKRINRYFTIDEIIPAAGQGIIAVQGRKDEDYSWLKDFGNDESRVAALCERAFVRRLNGGCSSPVCAHLTLNRGVYTLSGLYYDEKTGDMRIGVVSGMDINPEEFGERLAERLMNKGETD